MKLKNLKRNLLVVGIILFPFLTLAQSFLTNGLIAYYPFNENTLDGSGNSLDGIQSTNCWFVTDRFGNTNHAIFATNDQDSVEEDTGRVDIPPSVLDNLTTGTITAWVKPSTVAFGDIVAKQHSGVGSYAVFSFGGYASDGGSPTQGNAGMLYFHPRNYGPLAESATAITSNTWQQVVVVFTDTSCSFYINGVLSGTNADDFTVPSDLDSSVTTSIGCWYGGIQDFNQTQQRLVGAIDDVRIYNRALSSDEVQQLYQIENAVSQGNPKLNLGKVVFVKFSNLNIGYSYQLQVSTNATDWIDSGAPFVANQTNSASQYFNVDDWRQLFFRLH